MKPLNSNGPGVRSTLVSRRGFLYSSLAAAATLGGPAIPGSVQAGALGFKVLESAVISQQPEFYHGWPTLTRRPNGELWAVWSGGREAHVCPFGQVCAMTSLDNGATWTWPRVLLDSAIDDRDAGVMETAKGSLLVTTFTSLAYVPGLEQAEKADKWPAEKLARWRAAHRRLGKEAQQKDLGQWMLRSTDGGRTWSTRYDCTVNSPHGPVQLRDGRVLYAGKELWTGDRRIGVCASGDDGQTWQWLAEIRTRKGDEAEHYHELHAVECANGTLIVHIRNDNKANGGETLQTESTDGGTTWSEPHSIGVWGLPSHLLRLRDGRLLMSYGHRRPPLGNQARLSDDNGKTWSDAMMLSGDGASGDLGYPSSAELDDGSLLTVWYEQMQGRARAVLRQARWTLG
ncbi:MAG: exo-alpha-sialidase [Pedosphaera sp.]|nr:exo-alpha-sialidase [Pedosphaera sp.]